MSSNSARPGKPGKASSTLRRQELRRRLPRTTGEFWARLRKPEVVYGLISSTVFVVMLTSLIAWAQTARHPYVGELIHQPIVNLVDFEVEFAFKNRLFEMLAGQMFDKALRKMIGAFETRAAQLYAPDESGSSSSSAHSAA